MYCHNNPINRTDPTGLYDLPEVVVTAPAPKKHSYENNFIIQQLLSYANRSNTQQIPRITTPTPSVNLFSNNSVNNAPTSTNNKDSKQDNSIQKDISDAVAAVGIASESVEIYTVNNGGKEIVYVTLKGTSAIVQTQKVLSVLKGIGTTTIVLGVAVDVTRSILGDPKQPWSKTGVNTGVTVVAAIISGGPGLALGAGYYLIDNTIGWEKVMTPVSNDQWMPNRAVFPDGSSTYVCFKAGTKILSGKGLKPIEQISVGDSVYAYNLEKDVIELNKVVKSFERKTQEIYEITTDNQKIFVTAEHPFYIKGKGWVKVKNIQAGEVFKTKNSSIERVTSIKNEKHQEVVYNIEVEGNHNYFITNSNILVHNK